MDRTSTYTEHAVVTQSPGRLIVMLYDGAIKFLNQAIAEIEAGKMGEKGKSIVKAMHIIQELDLALNREGGGEIAEGLEGLYDFMCRHLGEANVKRDPNRIREVIRILEDLNDGWRAIAK
jgi:flagellar secretion chaperone FliS